MEEVKNVSGNGVCCHFRNGISIFFVGIFSAFLVFYIYSVIILFEVSIAMCIIVLIAVFMVIVVLYYFLKMINKKIILTDKTITMYDVWGRKKEYELSEVTQIIFNNYYRNYYVLIKVGKDKFKIERYATNRDEFESKITKVFGVKRHSGIGSKKFDL